MLQVKLSKADLLQHYKNLMTKEIIAHIKYLKIDEKLSVPRLHARLIETYPQFKINFEGVKNSKYKPVEGSAIYRAAKAFDKNSTKLEDWVRW